MRQTKATRYASSSTALLAVIALASLTIAPLSRTAEAAETEPTTQHQTPATIPLGHPDFYPSAERPIGWRGDWTGAWPGARCVTRWNAETGENIVWKLNTPDAGFSQPIVVGEKVFIKCQPNLLVCVNIHNGEILWQTEIDHTRSMDPEVAEKARAEIAFFHNLRIAHGRWYRDCERMVVRAEQVGLKFEDVMRVGEVDQDPPPFSTYNGSTKAFMIRNPEKAERAAKFLENATVKTEWQRLWSDQMKYGYLYTLDDHVSDGFTPEIRARFEKANALYDIWFDCAWEGWCLWDFSAPCSDGEYVYVETVHNAVAAVSVADGSIKWQIWDHLGDENGERRTATHKGVSTAYAQSPVLYGNYLFMNQARHVRAYDKRTGEKLWEYQDPYTAQAEHLKKMGKKQYTFADALADNLDWTAVFKEYGARKGKIRPTLGSRSAPEATSPVVVEVPLPDGSLMPVVYDGGQILYRLEDGKVLCANLPFAGTGGSPPRHANLVMGKQLESGSYMVRLTAKDRDTLAYDWLHYGRLKDKDPTIKPRVIADAYFLGSASGIWYDGYWYGGFDGKSKAGIFRVSGKDGSIDSYGGPRLGGAPSPIMAGSRIYNFTTGELYKNRMRPLSSIDGVADAQCFDLESGLLTGITLALVDKRLLEDSDYALRNLTTKAGQYMANGSPCAQAIRLFMRTKGVLYCIGDPGVKFLTPEKCPSQARVPFPAFEVEAASITAKSDTATLTTALSHAHARVRMEAARRLGTVGVPAEAVATLQNVATKDMSVAVRAEALKALGLGVDQPGGKLLMELMGGESGSWQQPDSILGSLLEKLGHAVEPAALALLGKGTLQQKDKVAAALMYRFIPRSDALRDALIPVLTQRKSDGLMARCLSVWANDPVVTAAFVAAINDNRFGYDQPAMFEYLLPQQKGGERLAFLKSVVGFNGVQQARRAAIQALVADGAVSEVRPLMAAATGRTPAEIANGLLAACADHQDPAVRAAAVDIIAKHLTQEDKNCQMNMVNVLGQFGADAAPALAAIKAINPGEDKKLKEACDQAVAGIEAKVSAEKK